MTLSVLPLQCFWKSSADLVVKAPKLIAEEDLMMWNPPLFPAWYPAGIQLLDFQLSICERATWFLLFLCCLGCLENSAQWGLISLGSFVVPVAMCLSLVGDGHLCYYTCFSLVMSCTRFLCGFVSSAELLLWWLCSISAWACLLIQTPAGTCPTLPLAAEKAGLHAVSQCKWRLVVIVPICISPS